MSRAASPITLRPGGDDDVPAVVDLMKVSLGEGSVPRTTAFWRWKHRENPFGPSPMWLAESDGQLVGVRLFMRWRFRAGERDVPSVRAVDTATHPNFQGKGIFKKLTLQLLEEERRLGTQLVFNTPNAKSRPGYMKMGWSNVGRLGLWVRPTRPLNLLLAALKAKRAQTTDDPASRLDPIPAGFFSRFGADGTFRSESTRLHTPIDERYLSWRYRAAPDLHYGVEGTSSDALLVYRLRRRGRLRELRLCEVLQRGISRRTSSALSGCLARVTEAHRPDFIVAALRPELSAMGSLAALGFVPAPYLGPILTAKPLATFRAPTDPLKLGSWSVSIGDMELF